MTKSEPLTDPLSPRQRVKLALQHQEPDRVPVDFLATPEVWQSMLAQLKLESRARRASDYFDPAWEALLAYFEVDCRLLSYDQFCRPPELTRRPGATLDWWRSLSRSTPNRMYRQYLPDGSLVDIWGRPIRIVAHGRGVYEEAAGWALSQASSVADLRQYPWPEPDWWDFSPVPEVIAQLDQPQEYHLRFRLGSVFETAWQLRGMQELLTDLALNPALPLYIMDRICEVLLENTRRVLELAGQRLDMVYFYDDVATQNSLLVSPKMWRTYIRPYHCKLIELAKAYRVPVMYHCDGSIYRLIPELIDMGVDLLNPIQPDARDMAPERLKAEFGERLSFHGGIDIIKTLPRGSPDQVRAEVRRRVRTLGAGGGYILASSHHIQPDTPLENVLAMYEPALRYRD
jgi:uroporphyrinogen decarboxylase